MIPKPYNGRTGHHGAHRGAGRGISGGRWGRQMRNGYQIMHNPIRTIRCKNRSCIPKIINGLVDEIELKNIKDSQSFVKYNYPAPVCRCYWMNYARF